MQAVAAKRQRLPAREAKARILEAAEKQLIEGGPSAVRVQVLARGLGITDAAIHHHFGNREGLLAELLRSGGRRLRREVTRVISSWDDTSFDLGPLIDEILHVLDDRGYGRLALQLAMAGQENKGRGFFDDFTEAVRVARRHQAEARGLPAPSEDDTRRRAALFAATMFAEPVLGDAARRSVSAPSGKRAKAEYRRWLASALRQMLLAPEVESD
ncbi:MAG: helix-turn-helix domain-containing protein [Myxococcota bacterium]